MSWNTLEELQSKLDNKGKEPTYNKKYCRLVHDVFASEEAKKLLDVWKEMILTQTTYHPNSPKDSVLVNEGQHNFIRHILTSIKIHSKQFGA